MRFHWKKLFPLSVLALMASCHSTHPLLKADLVNDLDMDRTDQPVLIDAALLRPLAGKTFLVRDKKGTEIGYQWLTEGTGTPVRLLLLADFGKKETKRIVFESGKPAIVKPRVYGRYIPERLGDFAWENDRIAFRMYGKPLESKPEENAYGLDVWAKKTPELVVNKWYKMNDYHHDHGEGLDFFKVGSTLGAGDVLPFLGDTLNYLGNYTSSRILDSGPLRISFELDYPEVSLGNIRIGAKKTISLDAGTQINQETVLYRFQGADSLPVLAGIVHWNEAKGIRTLDKENGWATYWEPAQGKDGSIATAIYFPPDDRVNLLDIRQHLGGTTFLKSGETFHYFNGAAWDKAGKIKSPAEWNDYLRDYAKKQQSPIRVIVAK